MSDGHFELPKLTIDKPIRLIELFAGIGSQAMALRNIGADFEPWFVCEFDRFAMASYNAIHGTSFETTDIRNVKGRDLRITDKGEHCYLMTYSFPCSDLSAAGRQAGMRRGSGTRSGLLWEVERILKELPKEQLPDVLLMENVPQVHGKKNIDDFNEWLSFLSSIGYKTFWKDLNAKDCGIPQNRARCFAVSILSNEDVEYEFPEPVPLEMCMGDLLEESVGEKYYINSPKALALVERLAAEGKLDGEKKTDRGAMETGIKVLGEIKTPRSQGCGYRIYSKAGLAPCVVAQLGGLGYMVVEREDGGFGRDGQHDKRRIDGETRGTVTAHGNASSTSCGTFFLKEDKPLEGDKLEWRIRKLTPKECWRLMAFKDSDFEKAEKAVSSTQLYKQAGNAIVVPVLEALFLQMGMRGKKRWNEMTDEERRPLWDFSKSGRSEA